MIVLRLVGRLGNQMFEYATAYALGKEYNKKVKVYKFELDTVHRGSAYDLDILNMEDGVLEWWKIPMTCYLVTFRCIMLKLLRRGGKKIKLEEEEGFSRIQGLEFLNETPFQYKSISPLKKNTFYLMNGFFQSPKYFEKYRCELLKQFTPRKTVSNETEKWLSQIIGSRESVSIHVRRGDYVALGSCASQTYYETAINIIKRKINKHLHFFIFSDDIKWTKDNLIIKDAEVTYIKRHVETHPFEDIWLMKHCRHNIIANSTFSWWGAYLNEYPKKVVIAPELMRTTNNKDCFPDDWIIVE